MVARETHTRVSNSIATQGRWKVMEKKSKENKSSVTLSNPS